MGPGDALPSDRGPEADVESASAKSTIASTPEEASEPAPVPASEVAFSHSFEMSLMLIASELSIFDLKAETKTRAQW